MLSITGMVWIWILTENKRSLETSEKKDSLNRFQIEFVGSNICIFLSWIKSFDFYLNHSSQIIANLLECSQIWVASHHFSFEIFYKSSCETLLKCSLLFSSNPLKLSLFLKHSGMLRKLLNQIISVKWNDLFKWMYKVLVMFISLWVYGMNLWVVLCFMFLFGQPCLLFLNVLYKYNTLETLFSCNVRSS